MEEYRITLMQVDTKVKEELCVKVDEAEQTDYIAISAYLNGENIVAINENYLSAFQEFRDKMFQLGYGLMCNGSRLNVIQSGMMAASDRAYLVELGIQALMKDVVHIWDYTEINIFPNSQEQKEYAKKLYSSLRRF